MTLYVKCLCGNNREIVNKYKGLGYDIKVTNNNKIWRNEAMNYRVTLPFIVINGEAQNI